MINLKEKFKSKIIIFLLLVLFDQLKRQNTVLRKDKKNTYNTQNSKDIEH